MRNGIKRRKSPLPGVEVAYILKMVSYGCPGVLSASQCDDTLCVRKAPPLWSRIRAFEDAACGRMKKPCLLSRRLRRPWGKRANPQSGWRDGGPGICFRIMTAVAEDLYARRSVMMGFRAVARQALMHLPEVPRRYDDDRIVIAFDACKASEIGGLTGLYRYPDERTGEPEQGSGGVL